MSGQNQIYLATLKRALQKALNDNLPKILADAIDHLENNGISVKQRKKSKLQNIDDLQEKSQSTSAKKMKTTPYFNLNTNRVNSDSKKIREKHPQLQFGNLKQNNKMVWVCGTPGHLQNTLDILRQSDEKSEPIFHPRAIRAVPEGKKSAEPSPEEVFNSRDPHDAGLEDFAELSPDGDDDSVTHQRGFEDKVTKVIEKVNTIFQSDEDEDRVFSGESIQESPGGAPLGLPCSSLSPVPIPPSSSPEPPPPGLPPKGLYSVPIPPTALPAVPSESVELNQIFNIAEGGASKRLFEIDTEENADTAFGDSPRGDCREEVLILEKTSPVKPKKLKRRKSTKSLTILEK